MEAKYGNNIDTNSKMRFLRAQWALSKLYPERVCTSVIIKVANKQVERERCGKPPDYDFQTN